MAEPMAEAGADPAAQADAPDVVERAEAAELAEEQFERRAGELRGEPATPTPEPGIEVAAAPAPTAEQSITSEPLPTNADIVPPTTSPEAPPNAPQDAAPTAQPVVDTPTEAVDAANAAKTEPERRAPRGRFERFYAPGQRPHPEHNGHGAPAPQSAPHPTSVTGANGANGVRPLPHESQPAPMAASAAEDEDAEAVAPGPREDVRGAVGELIDSLHGLFTQDRAVASQGGSSRCGICYFHYPIAELVYREAEGFYVCQSCERALGSARLNMVRRQQRM